MLHIHPPQGSLPLHTCLEELARSDEPYLLTSAGDEWTARELLSWLQTFQPQVLQVRVIMGVLNATGEGVIYEVDQKGDVLADVPLYHLIRQASVAPPSEDPSQQMHPR